MTELTPADAFLSEVHEINSLIDDILSCPRKSNWHWPSFYLLYVDVDRLAMALMRTEHFFMAQPVDVPTTEDLVDGTRAVLGELGKRQRAIVPWLYPMSRRIACEGKDSALHARLDAHVHPKSGWYQTFFAAYAPGTLSADGKVVARTILPLCAAPPFERIDHDTAQCMLRTQAFAAGTPEERAALADATRQAAVALGAIAGRMQAYLSAYCTLDDLFHPCSA